MSVSHRQDRWCCWWKQRQQASGWGRWWAGAPEARPAGRTCRSLTSERLPSPHVHGSQLPRCCDRGPLCLHLMARGSHRPLLTQGGRDVPSHPVGSHQLGRQRSPPLLPSAEHGAHKTAKMEQSGGQRHATKLCLQSSPAWTSVTTSSERAEARQPATSQLRRQESALGSSGRASGTHRCPEAPDGATGSEVLPDPGGGTEGAQNEPIPWAPETCWPPRDHRQPSQQSLRPRGDVGAVSSHGEGGSRSRDTPRPGRAHRGTPASPKPTRCPSQLETG